MKCNHCGAEIADDSIFCEHCGKNLIRTKTIDIRWCLLPSIILSALFFCLFLYSHYSQSWNGSKLGVLPTLVLLCPLIILCVIAIIYGIRKVIRLSFLIFSLVLLLTNVLGLILVINSELSKYQHSTLINGNSISRDVYISVNSESYYYDDDAVNNQLLDIAKSVKNSLIENGYDGAYTTGICSTDMYYYYYWSFELLIVVIIEILIYLLYAFVAYKKNIRF